MTMKKVTICSADESGGSFVKDLNNKMNHAFGNNGGKMEILKFRKGGSVSPDYINGGKMEKDCKAGMVKRNGGKVSK